MDYSSCKLCKIWVDKGSEFYNRSMKLWLPDNNIKIYSTNNDGKSVTAERTKIDFGFKNNGKDPEFKFVDRVRISKYKNILGKSYTSNWSEEVFVIKKVKSTVPSTYVIKDLNGEEIVGTYYGKKCK